jgi:hypothetical protein
MRDARHPLCARRWRHGRIIYGCDGGRRISWTHNWPQPPPRGPLIQAIADCNLFAQGSLVTSAEQTEKAPSADYFGNAPDLMQDLEKFGFGEVEFRVLSERMTLFIEYRSDYLLLIKHSGWLAHIQTGIGKICLFFRGRTKNSCVLLEMDLRCFP